MTGAAARAGATDLSALAGWPGVRLWLFDLAGEPSAAQLGWLSADERARAARFAFERDRRRYLAAHTQLRGLLAQAMGRTPASLRFLESVQGKPRLDAEDAPTFNLSHSAEIGALALAAQGEIGVDIEVLHRVDDLEALAQRCFTTDEQRELAECDEESTARELLFLHGWTRKEACLKAVGSGLSLEPASFEAGLSPAARDVRLEWDGRTFHLALHSFRHGDTIGAIAVQRSRD
ncbi:MAG TPA: 4'-phosphopantetheinyl transferase superfamily protein [Piscinibacter sp.]|jgi:4'-phosphopantetheinyl transferase|nr:4'-phosphopantetheinyl transferase superfamily protein [Piscinibacter sp.]HPG77342.1 4'-phosphopantetheinyl transferase superfamily protein [Piscinibacter sp.]HPM65693.1 4'-phosphopantetheinyl transferase superfamily protein [Piscinibacter sp.]